MSDALRAAGPTVPRIMLGSRLRRAREEAGLSRDEAGAVIGGSETKIGRIEHGRTGCQDRDVTTLAESYGLTDPGVRSRLLGLARESRKRHPGSDLMPSWLATYVDLEEAAALIRTYELQFVPGLLQTPGYARALIVGGHPRMAAAEVEQRVTLRMARAQLLVQPDPPKLWAVIDEAALRRAIGAAAVMRAQLEYLLEASKLPSITLQVIRAGAGVHAAEGGAFSLLRFPGPELPDVVYLEYLTRGVHLDNPAEVDTYVRAVDNLAVHAATPGDSAELIADLRDRLSP